MRSLPRRAASEGRDTALIFVNIFTERKLSAGILLIYSGMWLLGYCLPSLLRSLHGSCDATGSRAACGRGRPGWFRDTGASVQGERTPGAVMLTSFPCPLHTCTSSTRETAKTSTRAMFMTRSCTFQNFLGDCYGGCAFRPPPPVSAHTCPQMGAM